MTPPTDKDALKQLREERVIFVERAKETIKSQNRDIQAIKATIQQEGKTVPDIAQATGLATADVLRYIVGLRKYGKVAEGPKADDYFTYQWIQ
jgi:predicted Rossmann fold nucleotide-binding protein DprA/Smf involved in DNA uptake